MGKKVSLKSLFQYIFLESKENVKVKDQLLESKNRHGVCHIDLPLNTSQAATLFEWKLKIVQISSRKETYTRRIGEIVIEHVENEILLGISNKKQDVLISSKTGISMGRGSYFNSYTEHMPVKLIMKQDDIITFQFDCTTGTFFVRKNDDCRILLGYVKNLKSLQTNPFYPCVRFESSGDIIEILSAGPIHNLIYSTPLAVSKSHLNIISTSDPLTVLFMLFAVCIACYLKNIYKK